MLQVKRSNPLRVYLTVLNGPYRSGGKHAPVLFEEDMEFVQLGDELFTTTNDGHTALLLGPPNSDNGYLFVPKGGSYELECQGRGG